MLNRDLAEVSAMSQLSVTSRRAGEGEERELQRVALRQADPQRSAARAHQEGPGGGRMSHLLLSKLLWKHGGENS